MSNRAITPSCPFCKICGKQFHRLVSHLKLTHNITKEEYLNQYPNSKLYSDEYLKDHETTKRKIQNYIYN